MEVILMTNVENLGSLGDIVKVRSGYARNYLLPYGKAQPVTPENLAELEERKAKIEEELRKEREAAQARAEAVSGKVIDITVARSNTAGEIDGGIGTFDIVKHMHDTHSITIERSQVRLPEGALHTTGTHEVAIHFHPDVEDVLIQINIASEVVVEDHPGSEEEQDQQDQQDQQGQAPASSDDTEQDQTSAPSDDSEKE